MKLIERNLTLLTFMMYHAVHLIFKIPCHDKNTV